MTRRCGPRGRKLIRDFEGCKLTSYRCPRGIWTCGIGSTGPDILPGVVWTQDQAEARFIADLDRFEKGVEALVKVRLSQNQFDALVSFSFNVGLSNLAASTLLKKLNGAQYSAAAEEFGRWIHAGGAVLPGLIRRRTEERDLFLSRA